jgi:hypothetical protein
MTAFSAFHGNAAIKAQASSDAQAGRHPGWSCIAADDDRSACAEQFGLAPAFINLVAHAMNVPYRPESLPYLVQALEVLRPGADTLALTRGWVLKIAGTSAHAPASEVIRLIEASAVGTIPREAWRRARAAISAAKANTPADAPCLDLVAAMAWDLASTPRVTTDIWNAWEEHAIGPTNRAAGWGKAAQDEVLEEVRRSMMDAATKLGPRPEQGSEAESYDERHLVESASLLKAAGYAEKFEMLKAHFNVIGPLMQQWRQVALQSILDACRDAQPA